MAVVLHLVYAVGTGGIHVRLLQKIDLRILSVQRAQNPRQIGVDPFPAFRLYAGAAVHKEICVRSSPA